MFLSLSLGRRGGFRFWVKMAGKYVCSSEILPGFERVKLSGSLNEGLRSFMGAEAVVLAFRVDDREGFQGRVSSHNGGLFGHRWRLQVGVGGCGYCGLWRGVRGSAATRATRCSVGMVRAAAA